VRGEEGRTESQSDAPGPAADAGRHRLDHRPAEGSTLKPGLAERLADVEQERAAAALLGERPDHEGKDADRDGDRGEDGRDSVALGPDREDRERERPEEDKADEVVGLEVGRERERVLHRVERGRPRADHHLDDLAAEPRLVAVPVRDQQSKSASKGGRRSVADRHGIGEDAPAEREDEPLADDEPGAADAPAGAVADGKGDVIPAALLAVGDEGAADDDGRDDVGHDGLPDIEALGFVCERRRSRRRG